MSRDRSTKTVAALQTASLDNLVRVSFQVMSEMTRLAAEENMSLTSLRLLAILQDRQPRMADLAAALGIDRSSVSGLIARAEQRGLVVRTAAEVDGRGVVVGLTDAGRSFTESLSRRTFVRLAPLVAALDADEHELLASVLKKVGRA